MAQRVFITGALSRIGNALAHKFAQNRYDLVLVANIAEKTLRQANEIRSKYPIDVTEIIKYLTNPQPPKEVFNQLKNKKIDVLVNDVGVWQKEKFHESEIDKDLTIIRLNMEALVRLTKLFIKDMVSRGNGRILNLGSVAGFQPEPLLAVYHASKAFMVSFSEALAKDLEGTFFQATNGTPSLSGMD